VYGFIFQVIRDIFISIEDTRKTYTMVILKINVKVTLIVTLVGTETKPLKVCFDRSKDKWPCNLLRTLFCFHFQNNFCLF